MIFLYCWLFHRSERTLLVPGILPWGLDAVVFCTRCDQMRGWGVRVLRPSPMPLH